MDWEWFFFRWNFVRKWFFGSRFKKSLFFPIPKNTSSWHIKFKSVLHITPRFTLIHHFFRCSIQKNSCTQIIIPGRKIGRETKTRWWFPTFSILNPIWGRFPIWRAYFSNKLKPPTGKCVPVPYFLGLCGNLRHLSPERKRELEAKRDFCWGEITDGSNEPHLKKKLVSWVI